ncbi:MAG: GbsR/MarR family transcriptional regulator [Candidatus Hodarchaeota archaeon]
MELFQDDDPNMLFRLQEETSQFIEKCLSNLGLSPTVGKLVAFFSFHEGTFLQRDLSENLGVSVSAISRSLKYLEHWGIVEKRAVSGSKERLYTRKSNSFTSLFNDIAKTAIEEIICHKEELARIKEKWYLSLALEEQESPEAKQIFVISSGLIEWANILTEIISQAAEEIGSRSQEPKKKLDDLSTMEWDSKDRQTYLE